MEAVTDFIFLVYKITVDSDCSHEIKRHLLLGRKDMTNLDSVLTSRDITLLTKVYVVKAGFSNCHVMRGYRQEGWGPQMEETGCKYQTFFLYLSFKQQEETNHKYQDFFPSLYKIKRRFLLKFCVAMTTPGST